MADPNLNKDFPEKDLNQAVAIAAMCLQEEAEARPLMSDVVVALSFLSMVPTAAPEPPAPAATVAAPASLSRNASKARSAASLPRNASKARSVVSESDLSDGDAGSATDSEYSYYSKSSYSGSETGSFSSYSTRASSKHAAASGEGELDRKKTSRKHSTRESSQKRSSSKKTSDLTQKSTRKSSMRQMGEKITSMKSSVRIMGHKKSSMGSVSEDGGSSVSSMSRNSSRVSRGNMSFGLTSTGSAQSADQNMSNSSSSMRLGSDAGSIGHPFDRNSSSGSEVTSIKSR